MDIKFDTYALQDYVATRYKDPELFGSSSSMVSRVRGGTQSEGARPDGGEHERPQRARQLR